MRSPPNRFRHVGVVGRYRRGWSATETGIAGCGVIAFAFVVCACIAVYFGAKNMRASMSSNPVELRAALQKEVICDVPKGYDAVRGLKAVNVLGSSVGWTIVAPPDAVQGDNGNFDPAKTIFLLMEGPMMDQASMEQPVGTGPGRNVQKQEQVELKASGRKVAAHRRQVLENGVPRLEYQFPLRKNLVFLAFGPTDAFDQKAMDAFLGSMVLDQPGDLPTATPPKSPAKKQ